MELAVDDVLTITKSVFNQMLDRDVELSGEPLAENRPDRISGCVQISGAWQGAVVVQTSLGFATQAASTMLALAPDEVATADLQDTLAEIANMIGGNLKTLVPGPSFLSLPSVTTGQDFDFLVWGAKRISDVGMTADSQPVRVLMCEGNPDGQPRRSAQRH